MDARRLILGLLVAAPAALVAAAAVPFHAGRYIAGDLAQWPILALIDVGLMGGIACVLAGFTLARAGLSYGGAGLLTLAAIPLSLGLFGFPVLLSAGLVLIASRALAPPSPPVVWTARLATSTIAALFAILAVAGARGGVPVVAPIDALFFAVLGAFLWAAWWPRGAQA